MRSRKLGEGGRLASTEWGKPSLPLEPPPFFPKFSRNPGAQSCSEHPAQLLCCGFLGHMLSLEKEPCGDLPGGPATPMLSVTA